MKIDSEIAILKQDFLEEALEMIEECEQLFLGLEQKPDDSAKIVDQIFRLAHTIKGSGLAAGFQDLSSFAHDFESLLSKIGSDEIEITREIIDLLLHANDTLKIFVHGLVSDYNFKLDTSKLQGRIVKLVGTKDQETANHGKREKYGVFSMPSKAPEQNLKKASDPLPAKKEMSEVTILLCDDDVNLLAALSSSIERGLKVKVLKASNGRQALETIKENEDLAISVVITDLKMPEMNGLDFIRELRKTEPMLPVIFYSGYAEMSDLKEFINLGAYAFLPKPFKKDLMIFEIQKAIKNYQTQFNIRKLAELNFNTYIKLAHWSSKMPKSDLNSEKLEAEVLENLKKIQGITYKLVNQN